MQRPVNMDRFHELEELAITQARWIVYGPAQFWIGTDVCKVLGLAPSKGYGRRGYQKHFELLNNDEKITLPNNFGGQAHQRVMVDKWGIRTLAWRALQMEAANYCLIQRTKEQKQRRRPDHQIKPLEVPQWAQING